MIASTTEVSPNYTEDEVSVPEEPNYLPLDGLGRPTGMRAKLTRPLKRGTRANQNIKPPGYLAGAGHARGHLLGRQLGGSGNVKENLVTLYQNPVNTPIMSRYERLVRRAVEAGEVVLYTVTPIYRGTDSMPIAVTLNAQGSKGFNISLTIPNRK
jgi:hypothetical protein